MEVEGKDQHKEYKGIDWALAKYDLTHSRRDRKEGLEPRNTQKEYQQEVCAGNGEWQKILCVLCVFMVDLFASRKVAKGAEKIFNTGMQGIKGIILSWLQSHHTPRACIPAGTI